MITEEIARKHLETLHREGCSLAEEFVAEQREREKLYGKREPQNKNVVRVVIQDFSGKKKKREVPPPEPPPPERTRFEERYQSWYSRTLPLMKQLAPDRYTEFQSFYVVDPRYPWIKTAPYVIQDYFRGRESDDPSGEAVRCFKNQLAILKSVSDRLSWGQLDTEDQVARGLQLDLLETARYLINIDERAAGAMTGTVLAAYLGKLTAKHGIKLRKQAPPLGELADALKEAKVLDIPAHSQVTWLAEIRGRCLKEGETPTKLQVRDLVDGTRWLITNVF